MPVPHAIHLDACRRYATSPKALHAFQVFHAFHKCRVIVIVHLALHTPANAISDGGWGVVGHLKQRRGNLRVAWMHIFCISNAKSAQLYANYWHNCSILSIFVEKSLLIEKSFTNY